MYVVSFQRPTLHFNKYVSFIGLYARNSFSIVHPEQLFERARARATSASCHNRADGREAPGRKNPFLRITRGRAVGSAAVENHEKKRGELIVATGPRPLRFIIRPSPPLCTFLPVVFRRLGLSLPLFYGELHGADGDSEPRIDKRRVTRKTERGWKDWWGRRRDKETRKRERLEMVITKKGNELFPSSIPTLERTHSRTQNAASVCAALRFIAAPLTGGLRPSKGCACGYVHNTVHRRMHVGPWMRRRARWLRERETCARARARSSACVRVCVTFDVAWTTTAVQRPASRVEIARSQRRSVLLAFARVKIDDVHKDARSINGRSDRLEK